MSGSLISAAAANSLPTLLSLKKGSKQSDHHWADGRAQPVVTLSKVGRYKTQYKAHRAQRRIYDAQLARTHINPRGRQPLTEGGARCSRILYDPSRRRGSPETQLQVSSHGCGPRRGGGGGV